MTSIHLKLRQKDSDLIQQATSTIKGNEGNDWYFVPMIFKKIHDGLFVEYFIDDLPDKVREEIEKQIHKTETIY